MRPVPKKIALTLGSTLAFLLLAEILVRALGLGPTRFREPRHLETADKRRGVDLYPDDPRDAFEFDLRDAPVLARYRDAGLDLEPHREHTPFGNDLRYSRELCRGPAIPAPSDTPRIMVVGDSFAEGQGVRESETSAAQLADLRPNVEVLCCGRRGFDASDIRTFTLDRLEALDPDVLVYAYTLNDPEQSEEFAARQTYLDDWILDRRRMVRDGDGELGVFHSHLWASVVERMQSARVGRDTTLWYQQMVTPQNAEGWHETLEHIEAMDDAMRERGGEFLVVVQPLMVQLDAYPFEAVHAQVVQDLEARDIDVVDAFPVFRDLHAPSLWVHASDRHPNADAQRLIAEVMDDALP